MDTDRQNKTRYLTRHSIIHANFDLLIASDLRKGQLCGCIVHGKPISSPSNLKAAKISKKFDRGGGILQMSPLS
uniref:Uncharacterized protein n=1 Tax=Arundo donax TaxID=35708 RepID=A0A0A9CI46_ARUDO